MLDDSNTLIYSSSLASIQIERYTIVISMLRTIFIAVLLMALLYAVNTFLSSRGTTLF